MPSTPHSGYLPFGYLTDSTVVSEGDLRYAMEDRSGIDTHAIPFSTHVLP